MKYAKFILLLSVISITTTLKLNREFPWRTPKATDLQDHFGTEPVINLYGPKTDIIRPLAREGVTSEATPITPIRNFNQEIIPSQVVAGDLLNTSYDASKIIKAPLADPKFDIKETIVHEAVVKTPVHMGTNYEEKTVQTMNRVTGEVTSKHITVEKPIIGVVNNVREVSTDHQTIVNLKNGQVIDPFEAPVNHGLPPQ